MSTSSSPNQTALRFGGVMALLLGGLLLTLPHTSHLHLPSPWVQGAGWLMTVFVSGGIGAALANQANDGDVGDRAGVDAVLAGLLSMGLLTVGGMFVVGQSDGLFFAASAGAASISVLAWLYRRTRGHIGALAAFWLALSAAWTGLARLLF